MEDEVKKEGAVNGGKERSRRSNTVSRRTSGPTRRSTKGRWTPEEDALLVEAVKKHNGKKWKCIAACLKDRTHYQCLCRWKRVLNPAVVKGGWTKEEDAIIISLAKTYGFTNWSVMARSLPGRIGKQCRERWHNHLNPALKTNAWTKGEEMILIYAHKTYGNKWTEIAKFLPGRSDNSIKNHWNCSLKKRQEANHKKITHVKQERDGDCHFPTLGVDLVHQNASMGRKNFSLSIDNNVECSIRKQHFIEFEMTENSTAELRNHRRLGEHLKLKLVKQVSRSHNGKHSKAGLIDQNVDKNNVKSTSTVEDKKLALTNDSSSLLRCISGGSFSSIRNLQMPLMEEYTSCLSSEKLSIPEDYNQQVCSPVHYSIPPSSVRCTPNSLQSILRREAESFKTPSIIKRRPRITYLNGFGVDGQLERMKHIGPILEKEFICQGEGDNMVSINRRDMLLAQKFFDLSRDYLKLGTSNEFDRKET